MPAFRDRNPALMVRYGATRSLKFVRSDLFVDLLMVALPVMAAFGALLPVIGPFFGYRIVVLALLAITVGKRSSFPWESRSGRTFLALAGLWLLVGCLSLFWATDHEAATKELFNVTLGLVVCFVLVTRLTNVDSPLKVTTLGWTTVFVVTGGIAAYERLSGNHLSNYLAGAGVPARVSERAIASVFGNPNNFAAFLITAAPFLLLGLTRAKSRARKVLFLTSLVSLSLLLLFTGSRLCLLALALQGLVAVIFLARRRHQVIALSTVAILAIASLTGVASSLAKSLPFLPQKIFLQGGFAGLTEQLTSTDESGGVRLNLVRDGIWMATQTHGLGVGAGNFEANALKGPYPTHGIVNPHNLWIEVLSQYGIIVFLMFVAWLTMVLLVGLRLLKLKREARVVDSRALGLTIVLSILGNVIAATANSSYLESSVNWVLFGFLGALAIIGERSLSQQHHPLLGDGEASDARDTAVDIADPLTT